MKRRWLLIGLVVTVNVSAGLSIALFDPTDGAVTWLNVALVALLPGQGTLLGIWAALGGKATPWRLVAAVVGVAGCVRLMQAIDPQNQTGTWIFIAFAQMVPVATLLMVAHFLGTELTVPSAFHPPQPGEPHPRWAQFSLRSLFSWTTAMALLLGSLHCLLGESLRWMFRDPEFISDLAAILCSGTLIGLGAIWLALGTRWPPARHAVLLVTTLSAIGVLCLRPGLSEEVEFVLVHCSAQVSWVIGSLLLVRLAGYRLVWRRRVRL
jgi:hypothetical protein